MHCPACKAVNSPGRLYCGHCARVLGAPCPVCGFVNEFVQRYCGGCAWDLRVRPPAAAANPVTTMIAATDLIDANRTAPGQAPALRAGLELEDLDDLRVATERHDEPGEDAVEMTSQSDVDTFFRRLSQEGTVRIPGTAPGEQQRPKPGTKP